MSIDDIEDKGRSICSTNKAGDKYQYFGQVKNKKPHGYGSMLILEGKLKDL